MQRDDVCLCVHVSVRVLSGSQGWQNNKRQCGFREAETHQFQLLHQNWMKKNIYQKTINQQCVWTEAAGPKERQKSLEFQTRHQTTSLCLLSIMFYAFVECAAEENTTSVALTRIHLCSGVFKLTKRKFSRQKMLLVNNHHFLLRRLAAVWAARAPTASKTKHLESQTAWTWRWNVPFEVELHLLPLQPHIVTQKHLGPF